MTRFTRTLLAVFAVTVALVVAAGAAAHTAGKPQPAPRLSGTFLTKIALTNPPAGIDATFQALDTFVPGGGILVSSSQSHPTTRSLAHGSCAHTTSNSFTCTFAWFRFDPATGSYVGMQRVHRDMTLAPNGDSFVATETVQVIAPDGTVVASLAATETGQRLS
jgi:hypothetical protein